MYQKSESHFEIVFAQSELSFKYRFDGFLEGGQHGIAESFSIGMIDVGIFGQVIDILGMYKGCMGHGAVLAVVVPENVG